MKNPLNIFNNHNKQLEFVSHIINASSPKFDFYLLIALATAITSFGIIADNLVLIIAGMIIAPLLSSLLAISLGISVNSWSLIWRSSRTFLLSVSISFLTALLIGLVFPLNQNSWPLIQKMEVSYFSFFIAIIVGLTAAYTWKKSEIRDALPGIAIAVTLVPPIASLGLIVSSQQINEFDQVFQYFLLNVLGILLAGLLLFFIPNLSRMLKAKKIAEKEVKNDKIT
jgi:uncharacterized hydrophobic protein (TIGR00271 family)